MRVFELGSTPSNLLYSILPQQNVIQPKLHQRSRLANNPNTRRHRTTPQALPNDPDGSSNLTDVARALDKVFYSSPPATTVDANSTPPPNPHQNNNLQPGIINDLPLWRVQWAMLPGFQEVLHVHVPHYTDMFYRLFQTPRPWRFGHVLLPGGSANLGDPAYAMEPETQAPLVGTLVEVLQAVNFPDGRILLLCAGVARFKIIQPLQTTPHSRANVQLLLDPEELEPFQDLAMSSLDDIPMTTALEAINSAATAAAIAYNNKWADYDLCISRVHEKMALIDAREEHIAQEFGRRLISIGAADLITLPFGSKEGDDVRLDEVEATAHSAAADAVARVLEQYTGKRKDQQQGVDTSTSTTGQNERSMTGLNTTTERGVASQSASELVAQTSSPDAPDAFSEDSLPDTLQSALVLEGKIWQQMAAIGEVSKKLTAKDVVLPDALLCLIPPEIADRHQDNASNEEDVFGGVGDLPEIAYRYVRLRGPSQRAGLQHYPTARRLQRLSYALFTVLVDSGPVEAKQAWLESLSITARLKLALASLRYQSKVLAAVMAVNELGESTTEEEE